MILVLFSQIGGHALRRSRRGTQRRNQPEAVFYDVCRLGVGPAALAFPPSAAACLQQSLSDPGRDWIATLRTVPDVRGLFAATPGSILLTE